MDPKGPSNLKITKKPTKYSKRKAALNQKDDINEDIKYVKPQFDVEWEEANRYPYFDKLGQAGWEELAGKGKIIKVNTNSVKKIGNTGADGSESLDDLEPDKVARLKKAMDSGTVEMPIVVKQPDGSFDLVAGNTRLIGLINTQGEAKVWLVDASKLNESILDINEASEPEIYLDMDGVLVDFFNEWAKLVGVRNWRDIKNVEKSFELIKQQKNWWENLPTLSSAKSILAKIKEVRGQYKILSSPLAQDPDSVPGKKKWIKKNLSSFSPAGIILTHNKSKYAKKEDGTPNVLIDDFGKNIKGWESAGGIGIKHENNAPALTIKKLENVFKNKVNEETLPTNIVDSNIRKLGDIFDDAGYEVRIVGGAVRDIALGKEPKDIDFATDATPDEMIEMLDKAGVKHIPTGIEHGTITAVLNGEPFEITTLRADTETDGRKAKVDFIRNWKEDALRRDLTYNAMSMDIDGNLYDYFNGMDDLQNKVSKFVGDPAERIQEDYLRILRYFRFQSRLDRPQWDKETLKAIKIYSKGLAGISVERVWQEISKLLVGSSAYESLRYMETTGINKIIGLNNSVEKLKGTNYDNPIMALSSIVDDIQIAKQWKLSNAETAELDFYTSYKDTKFDSKKVRDMIVDGANKEFLKNVLVMQNENALAKEADTFTAPEFPVTGKDLLDKGLKSGPDLGKALANLKARWMDSNYELTKDQLLSNINEDFIDSIKRFIDVKTHPKNYSKAADVLHKLLQRKKRESKGKLRHSPEYYAQQIARTVNGIDGRALYRNYLKTYGDQVVEGIMLKLERDYDADMLILHVKDTKTDKRTEVRGKLGYEVGGYDKDDKLHQLLDKIGKTANISDMMNGDIVHINPNHPKGPEAIKTATKLANENFADGKKKGKSRPGRVKRAGASCKGSVTDLRRKAKNSSGEKAKMYHWCANMKSGRKKKK